MGLGLQGHSDNRHMKMARLSELRIGRLYPKERPQGLSEAGKIMSMKNLTDSIRNRTRNLSAWSAVPQQTALPRTPYKYSIMNSTKSPASGAT
jgi:hypothetical protein